MNDFGKMSEYPYDHDYSLREGLSRESRFMIANTVIDPLTNLPVMMQFISLANEKIESGKGKYALIYLDIVDFKAFNDNYGFSEGNDLLKFLADSLVSIFEYSIISRFSDDHFVVLTPDDRIESKILYLHSRIREYEPHPGSEVKAGIYEMPEGEADVLLACDRARYACREIKTDFNIAYRFFDETLKTKIYEKNYVISHFEEALEKGYIKVYYQPVIRSSTGELCGWEALARWEDPKRGMLLPYVFIETLEQYRLIHKLDAYIIQTTCSHYKPSVARHGATIPVSINLSRLDFELCDICKVVEDACEKYGCPRENIHLEVTESAISGNTEYLKSRIKRFQRGGYQVWLDDFGSGYSSFNVVKDYDFDLIKLDMKFLQDFDTNIKTKKILINILRMAKEIGWQTLAEGVETREQADFLRSIGCEYLQGYLYGRPMPVKVCEEKILEKGILMEPIPYRQYYRTLGRVNPLAPSPLECIDGGKADPMSSLPPERRGEDFELQRFLCEGHAHIRIP